MVASNLSHFLPSAVSRAPAFLCIHDDTYTFSYIHIPVGGYVWWGLGITCITNAIRISMCYIRVISLCVHLQVHEHWVGLAIHVARQAKAIILHSHAIPANLKSSSK